MDGSILDAAFAEVGKSDVTSLGSIEKVVLEALLGKFIKVEHPLTIGLLLTLLIVHLLFIDLDAILLAEPAYGFVEGHLLLFHQESDWRTAFAAGEAFADVLGRRNVERWRLVGMERTQTYIVNSAAP